jgi:hypothetical protein
MSLKKSSFSPNITKLVSHIIPHPTAHPNAHKKTAPASDTRTVFTSSTKSFQIVSAKYKNIPAMAIPITIIAKIAIITLQFLLFFA